MSLLIFVSCLPAASATVLDCDAELSKIAALDDDTLILVAEQLTRSYALTESDRAAIAKSHFFRAYAERLNSNSAINFAILRGMKLAMETEELAMLASLMPNMPRNPLSKLSHRATNLDFTDFVANSTDVIRRDEYRLAVVELLKRGADEDVIVRNVRAQNEMPGVPALQPQFTRKDLKRLVKTLQKKDTSTLFIAQLAQAVEAVIMEIIAYGRTFPNFAEEVWTVAGTDVHTMVDAEVIRRSATRYFRDKVSLSSPPHILRAVINTYANVEPLPVSVTDLRRTIARESKIFVDRRREY